MPTLPTWTLGPLDYKAPKGKAYIPLELVTVPASGLVPAAWHVIGLNKDVSGGERVRQLATVAGRWPWVDGLNPENLWILSQIILKQNLPLSERHPLEKHR